MLHYASISNRRCRRAHRLCLLLLLSLTLVLELAASTAARASVTTGQAVQPSDEHVYAFRDRDGATWRVGIRPYKGTLSRLQPNASDPFSFINDDTPNQYSTLSHFHSHGDITLRVRAVDGTSDYQQYSTSDAAGGPAVPVAVPPTDNRTIAAFDVTPLMRAGHGLQAIKQWQIVNVVQGQQSFDQLRLVVTITNRRDQSVELGALGFSALVSSNWNNMDLVEAAGNCSLAEPFVGGDHGFVKVTRLTGDGKVLLIMPVSHTSASVSAWRHLKSEDLTPTGYAFEGHYEVMAATQAWYESEWKAVNHSSAWIEPRSFALAPNQSVQLAYDYQLLPDVRSLTASLLAADRFTVHAIPGYVVGLDMQSADLHVHFPISVTNYSFTQDGEGAIHIQLLERQHSTRYQVFRVTPKRVGRLRLRCLLRHTDSSTTAVYINYFILPTFESQLERLGRFHHDHQFLDNDTSDPFGRTYSVMPYDFETQSIIYQDARSYVVGLSDEAGAGPGLTYATKNRYWPEQSQVDQLDRYINRTLWGNKTDLPFPASVQNGDYSVRASMFWYPGMTNYTYTVSDGWDQDRAGQLWRSYNYVHPIVIYHTMYRLARDNTRLRTLYGWSWYLNQAYQTYMAMFVFAPYYTQFGLMEGSVFMDLMQDLALEGWHAQAQAMDQRQSQRAQLWSTLPFPFGSEMPWDSTGQEEIWITAHYYQLESLQRSSLSAILAYTHSIPHWAYHGSSRRFWDYWINGSPRYTMPWPERDAHHYGAPLNGKPLLLAYESNPDDYYILEVGIGALTGMLTNIQPSGAASMAFHTDNGLLRHDPFDADYGSALYGHVTSSTSYWVTHPELGSVCYLCDFDQTGATRAVLTPRDSLRRRVYLEPLGTVIELDVGHFHSITVDLANSTLAITMDHSDGATLLFDAYRIRFHHPARCSERLGCDMRLVDSVEWACRRDRGAFRCPVDALQSKPLVFRWNERGEQPSLRFDALVRPMTQRQAPMKDERAKASVRRE